MELTFEILREAGVRLPKTVGQAVSIVGALVIGQAAVEANLVSPPMVIVVSITAIASFSVPAYNMAISLRLLRFPMMIMAGTLGFPGIVIGMMVLLMHLISLRSLGVPYWSPVAPLSYGDLKDSLVRVPIWAMFLRPRLVGYKNPQRQGVDLKPRPPKDKEDSN
jgi:spore germination protein KA